MISCSLYTESCQNNNIVLAVTNLEMEASKWVAGGTYVHLSKPKEAKNHQNGAKT